MDETPDATALADTALADTALGHEVEFVAARARSIGTAMANAAIAPLGLKVRSYSVLSLACSGTGPSQREIAAFLILDASQIVSIVDSLEAAGLVTRRQGSVDRRSHAIEATAAGHELYARAREAISRAEDEALAALDSDERADLLRLLRAIAFDGSDRA